jgi:hypothetical protein
MLRRTFQLIQGVGPWKEKDLWARGILTWDDFPETGCVLGQKLDGKARERLGMARDALARRDLKALASLIPPREHWRLYPEFARDAVYFDIETDGAQDQVPTVVALFDDAGLHVFIQGRNMDALPEAMAERRLWVTFNGSCFDVPVLRQYFGKRFPTPDAHIDLRLPAVGDGRWAEGDRRQAGAGASAAHEGRERVGRGAAVAGVPAQR